MSADAPAHEQPAVAGGQNAALGWQADTYPHWVAMKPLQRGVEQKHAGSVIVPGMHHDGEGAPGAQQTRLWRNEQVPGVLPRVQQSGGAVKGAVAGAWFGVQAAEDEQSYHLYCSASEHAGFGSYMRQAAKLAAARCC